MKGLPKRKNITKAEKDLMLNASFRIIEEEGGQVSLRHLFYRLVSLGLIDKTENGYGRLKDYTKQWRHAGLMPYSALTDNSRWYYGDVRYKSPEEAVASTLKNYRKDLWQDWTAHKEIWVEKDAMVPILLSVANRYGIKVFSTHGYVSIGSMANTVIPTISDPLEQGKRVFVYYFGDSDSSGVDIDRAAKSAIDTYLSKEHLSRLQFKRVAVLQDDIKRYNLPIRPPKKSDPRAGKFKGDTVEIDAMDIGVIKQRVYDCIMEHLPEELMEDALYHEQLDKDRISQLVRGLQDGQRLALSSGDEEST